MKSARSPHDSLMQAAFERCWEFPYYVGTWTNFMLSPPPPHVLEMLEAAQHAPDIASRFARGFDDARDFFDWYMEPDLAIARQPGRPRRHPLPRRHQPPGGSGVRRNVGSRQFRAVLAADSPQLAAAFADGFDDPRQFFQWWFDAEAATRIRCEKRVADAGRFQPQELRRALGQYATGVAVITARGADGRRVPHRWHSRQCGHHLSRHHRAHTRSVTSAGSSPSA